ncbi:MAG: PAS domain S-box protein [Deltaproteobacteria bacterium]|nr:PAS domain S-box protein [Deltaproteobacteria bacterium]
MRKLRVPLLAQLALLSSATGWIAAFYGAVYICAAGDLRATGSLWIFGGPFAALLLAATAAHAWLAGGGAVVGLRSPLAWVRTTNAVVSAIDGGEPVSDADVALAVTRVPWVPVTHTRWCSLLSAAVVVAMAAIEWRVSGGTRNVGAIVAGGTIATLLYAATTFTVCELLVGEHCQRLRGTAFARGLDPYVGPSIDTWVRVVVLTAPTVVALTVAMRWTITPDLPLGWLTLAALMLLTAGICGALGWLQALTIRRAGTDLAVAATRLAHGETVGLITGAIDAHLVRMARAFNAAASAIDRSRQTSAARYAALFEGAGDAILLIDAPSGRILEANRRAQQLTGHDEAMLKAIPFMTLFDAGPLGVDLAAGRWPEGSRVRRADGGACPVDVALSVVPLGDRAVIQVILHDMSQRERIETELRQAVQRLESLYHLAVTLGGSVEQVADHLAVTLSELLDAPIVAAARLVGDTIVLLALYEHGGLLHEGRQPLAGTACEHVRVAKRACVFSDATTRFPADGFLRDRNVETFVGVPVLGRSGAVEGLVVVLDTVRRSLGEEDMRLLSSYAQRLARAFDEEEYAREREAFVRQLSTQNLALSVAQERLTQADRLKSEFLGMMSHELRTPINIFIGYTELLLDAARDADGLPPAEHRAVLERMCEAARTLAGLVEDTLSVLRLESAGVAANLESLSLASVWDELRAADRYLGAVSAVREEWLIDADLPTIVSDRLKLRQILTNLVGNARKFTRAGTIRVRIARAPSARFTIVVEDTGCGIAAADLPSIFDLYRQAENGGVHDGCGIGLYIVRRYCELLGGVVEVTSEIGQGTRFTVTLPERPVAASGEGVAGARPAATDGRSAA